MHPGRKWADNPILEDAKSVRQIESELRTHFASTKIYGTVEDVLAGFANEEIMTRHLVNLTMPNRMLDDLGRIAMAFVENLSHGHRLLCADPQAQAVNLTMACMHSRLGQRITKSKYHSLCQLKR